MTEPVDDAGSLAVAAANVGASRDLGEADAVVRDEAAATGIALGLPIDGPATGARAGAAGAQAPRSLYFAFGALALLALIWGYNWVVMKVGLRDYPQPFAFAAMRAALAGVCTFAALVILRRPLRPKALSLTLIFSVLQTTGFMGLTMWAVAEGAAGKASVLAYTMPFWLVLLAWAVLGERPGCGKPWAWV